MPDSDRSRQGDASEELADTLRATIARFRLLLEQEQSEKRRGSIGRLLAEAEAALSELETPEEW